MRKDRNHGQAAEGEAEASCLGVRVEEGPGGDGDRRASLSVGPAEGAGQGLSDSPE